MGLDTSYVPMSRDDLEHYVLDVYEDPRLMASRLNELKERYGANTHYLELEVYPIIINHVAEECFDSNLGHASANLLAYLHPHYYQRGSALLKLGYDDWAKHLNIGDHFVSFDYLFRRFDVGVLRGGPNYCTGEYVPPEHVKPLLDILSSEAFKEASEGWDLAGFKAALKYALDRGLGVVEVFELFSPQLDTDAPHLRTKFRKNLNDERTNDAFQRGYLTLAIPLLEYEAEKLNAIVNCVEEWQKDYESSINNLAECDVMTPLSLEYDISEKAPIIFLRYTELNLLPRSEEFLQSLRDSIQTHLTNNKYDSRVYVDITHSEDALPFDSLDKHDYDFSWQPQFILKKQRGRFKLNDIIIDVELDLMGNVTLSRNGKKLRRFKASGDLTYLRIQDADVWYTFTFKVNSFTSGNASIHLFQNLHHMAEYQTALGSDVISSAQNWLWGAVEMFTLFVIVAVIGLKKVVLLPLLFVLLPLLYQDKRMHFYVVEKFRFKPED
ncbi:hypothetical protein [Thaumasiovibrio subtropicus]|uniref:hypothetical protein n=1 Tax=Thaumasiovibrio subtropicus TaxID=1891207 RepID=UPI000B35656E|nr:hypothetical protein [Thaumasiovibrio subtropicus]